MLFTAAKVAHLALLPQGRTEAARRVCVMTEEMLKEGFGNCGNHYECQAACPKDIKVQFIARLNREFLKAQLK
jgi:succinate dehydrogenase / fumarate reductase iron-sulfur subunit